MGFWHSVFCCGSSSDSVPSTYRQDQPPAGRPNQEAVRNQGTTTASTSTSPASHSVPASQPELRNRSHSVINNAAIPMDYVNTSDGNSAEMAMKGRRQSASILATPTDSRRQSSTQLATSATHYPPTTVAAPAEAGPAPHHVEETAGTVIDADTMEPVEGPLLPPQARSMKGRKTLVLDLDETLVHSSFNHTWNADFVIPVEIEGLMHDVYVVKRPGVDEFLEKMSSMYEVIVFTASVGKYGDPLLDRLDPHGRVHHRLFRESCQQYNGSFIKNLEILGRPLADTVIVDNSPAAYVLQPFNAVPVSSWFSDIHDNELLDMVPFLDELATQYVPNVTTVLRSEW